MGRTINTDDVNIGGSAFWILLIFIGLMSLIFLLIWSFFNNSIQGAIVSIIFTIMIIAGVLLSRLKVFDLASWGDNTLSFSLGFLLYLLAGSLFPEQSIIGDNFLFATLSTTLPQIVDLVVNVFLVPIAEELVWMIGIPFVLMTLMNQLGKKWSVFNIGWIQIFVMVVIGSLTFAIFHQGKLLLAFILASILFRSILIFLVYGDKKYDIIKGINLVAGFAVGAHIANNLVYRGIDKVWLVMMNNLLPVGLLIIAFFLVMFGSAIEKVISMFFVSNKRKVRG
jgi:hypothetical protein